MSESKFVPEEYAHEKGDMTEDHTPEFQKELTEAVQKTKEEKIAEIKKELFDRGVPGEYKDLIEKDYTYFLENDAHYEANLYSSFDSKLKFIADEVKNKIVLDLGCGHCEASSMGEDEEGYILQPYSLYVGVDLSPGLDRVSFSTETSTIGGDPSLPEADDISSEPKEPEQKKRIPDSPEYGLSGKILLVKDDMLRAVARMKSSSVKLVIMSGMEIGPSAMDPYRSEREIYDDIKKVQHPTYLEALHSEIKRVLEDGGLFINWRSDIWWNDDTEMVQVKVDNWSWNQPGHEEVLRKKPKENGNSEQENNA